MPRFTTDHPGRSCALLLALPCILVMPPVSADPIELELRSGGLVRGELLRERNEQLVVDLGFTVVSVPRDAVSRSARPQAKASEPQQAGGLYRLHGSPSEQSVTENVGRCAEAVVQVKTPTGLGSGFVIHPEGYVVTNHHVIAGEHQFTVTLFERNGQELRRVLFEEVRIVALDPHADLALLKIESLGDRRLPTVPLGDSGALVQGQTVFSVGSPLGFDRSISQGIVSLRNRVVDGQLFVQSTAQINPGNSGGPLFNLRGEVVGVNNMKIGSIGIEGLSFSIPSRRLTEFLDNADAFAFDTTHPNAGHRYYRAPAL